LSNAFDVGQSRPLVCFIPLNGVVTRPVATMSRAGLILFAGVLFGLIIPGGLYKGLHTFDQGDIAAHLPQNPGAATDPKRVWDAHLRTIYGLQKAIDAIDARIADDVSANPARNAALLNDITSLTQQRVNLQSALANMEATPPLSPFWVLFGNSYVCLASVLYLPCLANNNACTRLPTPS
jgi:hypothetical protein